MTLLQYHKIMCRKQCPSKLGHLYPTSPVQGRHRRHSIVEVKYLSQLSLRRKIKFQVKQPGKKLPQIKWVIPARLRTVLKFNRRRNPRKPRKVPSLKLVKKLSRNPKPMRKRNPRQPKEKMRLGKQRRKQMESRVQDRFKQKESPLMQSLLQRTLLRQAPMGSRQQRKKWPRRRTRQKLTVVMGPWRRKSLRKHRQNDATLP
mmetsp:Transcript_48824/g.76203  ORF Transcript_48824/g.76203 Transcript_48824/m.76203 type:complete len:202 (-) Transcript_48824:1313-1918(-)